jgi:hypothetical protein
MIFDNKKTVNFCQIRKYSNFSENDFDKQLALKNNLGNLLKNDMNLIKKLSPGKVRQLKKLDDIEEEENNKNFYDNFLNNLYLKEKRFKKKQNHKNNENSKEYMPVQKKSAKLLRFNKFKLTSALMKKLSNENNYNLNNNNELEKSNFDYTFKKESKISNSINPCEIPSTFEKQLELEEKEREKESRKENKKKSEQNTSLNLDKFHKNSSSLIIEKTEDNKKNKVEFNHTLKFFQKEIPYLKSEENKENGVNKDIENKVNKNISLEEKKQVLNLTPTNEKTYIYNGNKYDNKKKKICLCCIPII